MDNTLPSVYLDVCALNRPFDDQSQMRIQFETTAVHLIMANIRSSALQMIVSPVHTVEVRAIPDATRRTSLQTLLRDFGIPATVDIPATQKRAAYLHSQGMGIADASHVAYSEAVGIDFITVDDRLLRQCARIELHIWTGTPNNFCEKEALR